MYSLKNDYKANALPFSKLQSLALNGWSAVGLQVQGTGANPAQLLFSIDEETDYEGDEMAPGLQHVGVACPIPCSVHLFVFFKLPGVLTPTASADTSLVWGLMGLPQLELSS